MSQNLKKFQKLIEAGMTGRDAIKTIVSAEDDFSYIKTNLRQYQDKIVDIIMYDLGDIISDTVKKTVGYVEFVESDTRSYNKGNVVGLMEFTTGEIYHEMGHIIEKSDRNIHRICVKFLDERTEDISISLSDYYNDEQYDGEICQYGRFISMYAGKRVEYDIYTELLSVGLEQFNNNENIMKFYGYDPQHFEMILNIIGGK